MIRIVIRTDASPEIGIGHMMRCLTLADMLYETGAEISFVSRSLPLDLRHVLGRRPYTLYDLDNTGTGDAEETISIIQNLPKPLDWLIVDHYSIDWIWERKLRPYFGHICVIDDLANRIHECDLLLDQNYYRNLDTRYDHLVPKHCRMLLGPAYALLRPEIKKAAYLAAARTSVNRLLVTFGGSDPTDETSKVLAILEQGYWNDLHVDVVVGNLNPRKEVLAARCAKLPNVTCLCDVSHMGELMLHSDLAIGAGGITLWERMMVGLPSILIIVADNQKETASAIGDKGLLKNLGWHSSVTSADIIVAVEAFMKNSVLLNELSIESMAFMNKANNKKQHPLVEAILGGISNGDQF
jgi:UDP-2,4-diacetamido-2,4,6-trideoxy-beta-L-altropyranose hydrolase